MKGEIKLILDFNFAPFYNHLNKKQTKKYKLKKQNYELFLDNRYKNGIKLFKQLYKF